MPTPIQVSHSPVSSGTAWHASLDLQQAPLCIAMPDGRRLEIRAAPNAAQPYGELLGRFRDVELRVHKAPEHRIDRSQGYQLDVTAIKAELQQDLNFADSNLNRAEQLAQGRPEHAGVGQPGGARQGEFQQCLETVRSYLHQAGDKLGKLQEIAAGDGVLPALQACYKGLLQRLMDLGGTAPVVPPLACPTGNRQDDNGRRLQVSLPSANSYNLPTRLKERSKTQGSVNTGRPATAQLGPSGSNARLASIAALSRPNLHPADSAAGSTVAPNGTMNAFQQALRITAGDLLAAPQNEYRGSIDWSPDDSSRDGTETVRPLLPRPSSVASSVISMTNCSLKETEYSNTEHINYAVPLRLSNGGTIAATPPGSSANLSVDSDSLTSQRDSVRDTGSLTTMSSVSDRALSVADSDASSAGRPVDQPGSGAHSEAGLDEPFTRICACVRQEVRQEHNQKAVPSIDMDKGGQMPASTAVEDRQSAIMPPDAESGRDSASLDSNAPSDADRNVSGQTDVESGDKRALETQAMKIKADLDSFPDSSLTTPFTTISDSLSESEAISAANPLSAAEIEKISKQYEVRFANKPGLDREAVIDLPEQSRTPAKEAERQETFVPKHRKHQFELSPQREDVSVSPASGLAGISRPGASKAAWPDLEEILPRQTIGQGWLVQQGLALQRVKEHIDGFYAFSARPQTHDTLMAAHQKTSLALAEAIRAGETNGEGKRHSYLRALESLKSLLQDRVNKLETGNQQTVTARWALPELKAALSIVSLAIAAPRVNL